MRELLASLSPKGTGLTMPSSVCTLSSFLSSKLLRNIPGEPAPRSPLHDGFQGHAIFQITRANLGQTSATKCHTYGTPSPETPEFHPSTEATHSRGSQFPANEMRRPSLHDHGYHRHSRQDSLTEFKCSQSFHRGKELRCTSPTMAMSRSRQGCDNRACKVKKYFCVLLLRREMGNADFLPL